MTDILTSLSAAGADYQDRLRDMQDEDVLDALVCALRGTPTAANRERRRICRQEVLHRMGAWNAS